MTNWVIGAGGLLGSAVVRRLAEQGEEVLTRRIPWGTAAVPGALGEGLATLTADAPDWTIYWCAGAGTTDTSSETLDTEAAVFANFIDLVMAVPAASLGRGLIVYASSAGGVYGGSSPAPFTERTAPVPLGAYGAAKLAAEETLRRASEAGTRVLVGRISNLYGPGQNLDKPQGLITRLCLSALTRTPISIFVSLDTRRDYLFVSDAARLLVHSAARARSSETLWNLKIVASGSSTTIASVLAGFPRIAGSVPLVVTGTSAAVTLQSRDLRLRSEVWTEIDAITRTALPDGIARTMQDLRANWLQPGRLKSQE